MVGRHETSRQEPAFAQRQEALLGQSNLWEPALVLARQFFLDHAAIGVPLWDEPKPPPALTAAGTWWQRRTMTAHVQHLWKAAQSSPGEGVSQKEFRRLVASIDELTAAFQAGRARFEKIDCQQGTFVAMSASFAARKWIGSRVRVLHTPADARPLGTHATRSCPLHVLQRRRSAAEFRNWPSGSRNCAT